MRWDTPKVIFMHIAGMGDEAAIAAAVGKVFTKIKETSGGKGEVPTAELIRPRLRYHLRQSKWFSVPRAISKMGSTKS